MIVVATRDDPKSVERTLTALSSDLAMWRGIGSPAVLVVDDSVSHSSQRRVQRLLLAPHLKRFSYHGITEQSTFFDKAAANGASRRALSDFVRPLGTKKWDLGAIRNYCVLLSMTAYGASQILCLDDDIELPAPDSHSAAQKLLKAAMRHPQLIVGGRIRGHLDVSCFEAILLAGGTPPHSILTDRERVKVSGGFLAFSKTIARKTPFTRSYNEDWIWICRAQALGASVRSLRVWATHNRSQLHAPAAGRISREIAGEIYHAGWSRALLAAKSPRSQASRLRTRSFWRAIAMDYLEHYSELSSSAKRIATGSKEAHLVRCCLKLIEKQRSERFVRDALRDLALCTRWRSIWSRLSSIHRDRRHLEIPRRRG
jgi:hypothetical protein